MIRALWVKIGHFNWVIWDFIWSICLTRLFFGFFLVLWSRWRRRWGWRRTCMKAVWRELRRRLIVHVVRVEISRVVWVDEKWMNHVGRRWSLDLVHWVIWHWRWRWWLNQEMVEGLWRVRGRRRWRWWWWKRRLLSSSWNYLLINFVLSWCRRTFVQIASYFKKI